MQRFPPDEWEYGVVQLRDLDMERRNPRTVLAVILGGGAGTRLFPLTKRRAKPAVSFFSFYFTILLIILSIINIMVPITWLPSKIYFLIPWAIRKWKMCLVGNHIMIHAIYSALQLHKVISCYIYEFSHMGFPMVGSYWRSLQAHWCANE